ncbi:erythroid differentiation-related factor 1-like isoform X2 [Glandiceps talaboti]
MASIGPASSPDDSNTEEEFASRDSSEKENRDQGKDFAKIAVKDEVKSSAVVRYSRVQQLSMYSELKQHTDLKHPPANWLRSGSKLTFHNTWGTSRTRFSSFGMAHSSPDTVGDVDIISASENIKTLLKIPFCKAQVSIAVHRIGRTLFLDEFDIYRHLLSAPQSGRNWLRNFILHQISQDDGKQKFTRKRKTRDDLHSRSLLSKFLYYSIDSVGHGNENAEPYTVEEPTDSPDPRSSGTTQEDTVGDPPWVNGNEFARQVLWHFEDIQMLLGTDLPIFGGGKYPAVSLRLRDETKPINVLTGLDYWLDNLICNVPELAMCYHLNGIVQNYELLNTEEIPKLEDSQFSPRVIKDVAQNILSFLKSNCTKVGHTYWLFKGNNDDVVKLYDLSSLCSEAEAQWENPFSVPVAVLLYKVAKNMQQSNTKDRDKTTISKLLKNCLSLLDKEKHPQIVTSASYLLSDLCIPDTHLKTSQIEKSSDDDDDDDEEEEEEEEDKDDNDDDENEESCHSNTHSSSYGDGERDEENSDCSKSLEVKSLSLPSKHWHWREIEKRGSSTSSNHDNIKARKCEEALNYIVVGLTAIDRDLDSKSSTGRSPSHCAIEFPDVSQNEHKSTTNQNDDAAVSQDYKTMTVARRQFAPGSWQEEMKLTLLQKARVVCQAYANVLMKQNKLGDVLRYLQMALMCHSAVVHMLSSNTESGMSSLAAILSSCGDVHVMLAGHPENVFKYKDHFVLPSQHEQILTESIERIISANRVQWAVKWPVTVEECLVSSVRCYEASINESGSQDNPEDIMNVTRRLGNARNELGKLYMKQAVDTAEQVQDDDESPSKEEEILWKKSFGYFEGALKVFDAVNDTVNQALVNCNAGRLMRICAQAYNIGRFSQQERHYYNKAINYYQTAMRQLGDENSPIRESVSWELSTTYFTMATLLQDNAPLEVMAQEEVEKNIKDCMIKALKYCDVGEGSPRQPITQYRAATIHHRLASMHHNSYRNQFFFRS